MYSFIFHAHFGWRWIVLLILVIAVIKFLAGWVRKHKWQKIDQQLFLATRISIYIQLLLGTIMYIIRFSGLPSAFAMAHVLPIIIGVGMVEMGQGRAKRLATSAEKFQWGFIGVFVRLILIYGGIGYATAT